MPALSQITRSPIGLWAAWTAACALLILAAGSIGEGPTPSALLISVVGEHLLSGWPAILFLLAAVGYGCWITRFTKNQLGGSIRTAAPAAGLGFMLIHCLGNVDEVLEKSLVFREGEELFKDVPLSCVYGDLTVSAHNSPH